jgi:hypothetical protein
VFDDENDCRNYKRNAQTGTQDVQDICGEGATLL